MATPALVMKTNGVEWNGSFGVALRALVKDVLSDGEPFTATIRHQGSSRTLSMLRSRSRLERRA
jgi:hypothetical protein